MIRVFGKEALVVSDHWEGDLCAIGLQKDKKLIYISMRNLSKNYYFYECELLLDDPDKPYIVADSDHNVSEEKLLAVMSKFFEIERKDLNLG